MKGYEKFQPDSYYHIVNHAVGYDNLFRTDENYEYFLRRFAHLMPAVCSTLCYCLMPNHIHFLIKTHDEKTLTRHPKYRGNFHKLTMQPLSNLLNGYAKAYNIRYVRRGALWIDYTKRFKVDSDQYITNVINYIHQNPIRHGFTQDIEDWQHSSYHYHLAKKPTFLDNECVMEWFGGRENFINFHADNTETIKENWEY